MDDSERHRQTRASRALSLVEKFLPHALGNPGSKQTALEYILWSVFFGVYSESVLESVCLSRCNDLSMVSRAHHLCGLHTVENQDECVRLEHTHVVGASKLPRRKEFSGLFQC